MRDRSLRELFVVLLVGLFPFALFAQSKLQEQRAAYRDK